MDYKLQQRVSELEAENTRLRTILCRRGLSVEHAEAALRGYQAEHLKLMAFAVAFQNWLDNGMPGADTGHPSADALFDAWLRVEGMPHETA